MEAKTPHRCGLGTGFGMLQETARYGVLRNGGAGSHCSLAKQDLKCAFHSNPMRIRYSRSTFLAFLSSSEHNEARVPKMP
jgi:hypothetical protein